MPYHEKGLLETSIMPVLCSEFLDLENTSYRQWLRVFALQFIALKHFVFNLYQGISSISLGKEKVKSNFININVDLNWKKTVQYFLLR